MTDPMGGCVPLSVEKQQKLVSELATHPTSFVLFAKVKGEFVGMAVCFVNFSTFRCAPYINIHDLIVHSDCRGKGVGKAIMNEIINTAVQKQYCKVNLEVREDNEVGMNLYRELGFKECNPPMKFWERIIS